MTKSETDAIELSLVMNWDFPGLELIECVCVESGVFHFQKRDPITAVVGTNNSQPNDMAGYTVSDISNIS